MKREFTEQELRNIWSFLVETFELSDEQLAVVDQQATMTQEIYDNILDCCEELGPDADPLFFRMLDEYPEFMEVRAKKFLEEIKNVELPSLTPEEVERNRGELYEKIRAKYGEDAI